MVTNSQSKLAARAASGTAAPRKKAAAAGITPDEAVLTAGNPEPQRAAAVSRSRSTDMTDTFLKKDAKLANIWKKRLRKSSPMPKCWPCPSPNT